MSIPFVYIAMPCASDPEGEGDFAEETASSEKSKCLLTRRLPYFPIEEKFRLTVCREARQERSGQIKSGHGCGLYLQPARMKSDFGACPRNVAFTRLRERSSESKRLGEAAGALRTGAHKRAEKEKASKRDRFEAFQKRKLKFKTRRLRIFPVAMAFAAELSRET